MQTDQLDYHLPPSLIASTPADRRDQSRLLVAHDTGPVHHLHFANLPDLLTPGDLLILNDTRVLPARFHVTRIATGGSVEGLYLQATDETNWLVMLKSGGKLTAGESLAFDADARHTLHLIAQQPDGTWHCEKRSTLLTEPLLERFGLMPLPPYIRKQRGEDDPALDEMDRLRYQTVYARRPGAVAAPTAGLHFTDELLNKLQAQQVHIARLTLHVGMGTFAPVRTESLEDHTMHSEWFEVPAATLQAISLARAEHRRIIPVGTTSVRALESLPDPLPQNDYAATTELLIQPGYALRYCDGLITNFHLPRSTLIALVGARVGLERLLSLYQQAIDRQYRFYSYGDAMLILP